ncbi:MAG: iron-containing alcohol dehydrogenase [Ardenticatenaceae bacterium]|nr:iron-containing alcohol dehydrogenase [Ardenticatenaceae bacterium]
MAQLRVATKIESGIESRAIFSDQTFLFGPGAATARLAEELDERGWRRVIVLAGASAARIGLLDRLKEALGQGKVLSVHIVAGAHSPIERTEALAAELRDIVTAHGGCDALIALGGGKVIDSAKGVSVLLGEGGRLEDHTGTFEPPGRFVHPVLNAPKLPIVMVPTTLSGAEVTPGGGATNAAGRKRIFWDRKIAGRLLCYDPSFISCVPTDVLTTTGMNALAHCAEGLYSRTANPVSTAMALEATRQLAGGLRAIMSGKILEATYTDLGAGAAMAALVICNARSGLHHAICHFLGGRFHVPHGVANAIMLPHVLRFNLPVTEEPQRRFAEAVNASALGAVSTAAEAVTVLQQDLQVPTRLRDVGVPQSRLDEVAEAAMLDPGRFYNPRPVEQPQTIRDILDQAW